MLKNLNKSQALEMFNLKNRLKFQLKCCSYCSWQFCKNGEKCQNILESKYLRMVLRFKWNKCVIHAWFTRVKQCCFAGGKKAFRLLKFPLHYAHSRVFAQAPRSSHQHSIRGQTQGVNVTCQAVLPSTEEMQVGNRRVLTSSALWQLSRLSVWWELIIT